MRKLIGLVAIALLSFSAAYAAEPDQPDPADVSVKLAGEATGGVLSIKATLGAGVTRAARVYSLPSNTLLAVFVNENVPDPVTASWIEGVVSDDERAGLSLRTARFQPGVSTTMRTTAAPPADTTLRILLYGSWRDEDGIVREQELPLMVYTKVGHFAFSYRRTMRPAGFEPRTGDQSDITLPNAGNASPRKPSLLRAYDEVCCGESAPCNRECTNCNPPHWSCCYVTTEDCGWCGKLGITCGIGCGMC